MGTLSFYWVKARTAGDTHPGSCLEQPVTPSTPTVPTRNQSGSGRSSRSAPPASFPEARAEGAVVVGVGEHV